MENVDALKALYVALGGNLSDTYEDIAGGGEVSNYVTIPDMIEAVSKKATGGSGASLPAVTGADNGDVLTVVEGAWAKAGAPTELPAVTGADNGDVLTVVEGAWAKASVPTPYVDDWVNCTVAAGTSAITVTDVIAKFSPSRGVIAILGSFATSNLSLGGGFLETLGKLTIPSSADISHFINANKSGAVAVYVDTVGAQLECRFDVNTANREIILNILTATSVTLSNRIYVGSIIL